MLYSAQIRAARALLDWNRERLADAAGLGVSTVQRMEKGEGLATGHASSIWRLQAVLEVEGILFLAADDAGGPGVRFRVRSKGE